MSEKNATLSFKPIRTEEDHKEALERIDEIFDAEEGTPESDELDIRVALVKAYEDKTVHIDFPDPIAAIRFRMDQAGLTQRDLAHYIGSRAKVSEVLSGKRDITMSMARALHAHLGIPADVLLKQPGAEFGPIPEESDLRRFPWKEMMNRGWVDDRHNYLDCLEEMFYELVEPIGGLKVAPSALLRENGHRRINAKTNLYALTAWCWYVLGIANQNAPQTDFDPNAVNKDFMREVAKLSLLEDGPLEARNVLAEYGIALVVEKHLQRTYLDGAALRLGDGPPVIGLTLRYDRIDNFWFTLLHELAHVCLHLKTNEDNAFIDDLNLEPNELEKLEKQADEAARDALIPSDLWEDSSASGNPSPMAVYNLSREAEVHMAIAAGRVRYENNNYRLLSQFVGKGEVGSYFEKN